MYLVFYSITPHVESCASTCANHSCVSAGQNGGNLTETIATHACAVSSIAMAAFVQQSGSPNVAGIYKSCMELPL